jgi:hypothetical protein
MTLKIQIACWVLAIAMCGFEGCAGGYSEVKETRPSFHPVPVGCGALVNAEAEIAKGLQQDRSKPIGVFTPAMSSG